MGDDNAKATPINDYKNKINDNVAGVPTNSCLEDNYSEMNVDLTGKDIDDTLMTNKDDAYSVRKRKKLASLSPTDLPLLVEENPPDH